MILFFTWPLKHNMWWRRSSSATIGINTSGWLLNNLHIRFSDCAIKIMATKRYINILLNAKEIGAVGRQAKKSPIQWIRSFPGCREILCVGHPHSTNTGRCYLKYIKELKLEIDKIMLIKSISLTIFSAIFLINFRCLLIRLHPLTI